MYQLLDEMFVSNGMVTQPARLSVIRQRFTQEIDKVVSHLRTSTYDKGNNNPLVRALTIMGTSVDDTIFEAYDRYIRSVHRVAKACGFTSSLWLGNMASKSILYGEGYSEIVIVKDSEIDLLTFEDNWKDLSCIKVLRHPITSTAVPAFLEGYEYEEKGTVVIELDLVLMFMQYRRWLKEQIKAEYDNMMTMGQFLYQMVFPAAIKSHMDLVVLNRLLAHIDGRKPAEYINTAPITQFDYTGLLDWYLLNRITILTNRSLRFNVIASNISLFNGETLLDIAKNPDVTYTRQTEWVAVVAAIPVISMLVKINWEAPGDPNRQETNLIARRIRSILVSRSIPKQISDTIQNEIKESITRYI